MKKVKKVSESLKPASIKGGTVCKNCAKAAKCTYSLENIPCEGFECTYTEEEANYFGKRKKRREAE